MFKGDKGGVLMQSVEELQTFVWASNTYTQRDKNEIEGKTLVHPSSIVTVLSVLIAAEHLALQSV